MTAPPTGRPRTNGFISPARVVMGRAYRQRPPHFGIKRRRYAAPFNWQVDPRIVLILTRTLVTDAELRRTGRFHWLHERNFGNSRSPARTAPVRAPKLVTPQALERVGVSLRRVLAIFDLTTQARGSGRCGRALPRVAPGGAHDSSASEMRRLQCRRGKLSGGVRNAEICDGDWLWCTGRECDC